VDAPDGVLWFWIGTHADYDITIASSLNMRLKLPGAHK